MKVIITDVNYLDSYNYILEYVTSVPVVLAAACMRSLKAVLYFALMTLNSSRNEKEGIT